MDPPIPNMKELAQRLCVLELEEREADAYVHLLTYGAVKPAEIAKVLDINRSDAYRLLETLQRRGYVSATFERPTRFQAISPEVLFDLAESRLETRREVLQRAREETRHFLQHVRPIHALNVHRSIHGRCEIVAEFARLIRDAQKRVFCITTRPSVIRPPGGDGPGLTPLLIERLQAGLELRSITTLDDIGARRLMPILETGHAQIRHLSTHAKIGLVIADDREVLMWTVIDPSESPDAPGDVALYSNARALVESYRIMFEAMWSQGTDISELLSAASHHDSSGRRLSE